MMPDVPPGCDPTEHMAMELFISDEEYLAMQAEQENRTPDDDLYYSAMGEDY